MTATLQMTQLITQLYEMFGKHHPFVKHQQIHVLDPVADRMIQSWWNIYTKMKRDLDIISIV